MPTVLTLPQGLVGRMMLMGNIGSAKTLSETGDATRRYRGVPSFFSLDIVHLQYPEYAETAWKIISTYKVRTVAADHSQQAQRSTVQ